MMHHFTVFGYKKLNWSEDIVQTDIQWSFKPSLACDLALEYSNAIVLQDNQAYEHVLSN